MNRIYLLLVVSLIAVAALPCRAAVGEPELIAILQSNADVPQKCDACMKLRVLGTAKSVPPLAALLNEERTGQAARYALEGMSIPEAGAALRDALGKTSGLVKAGLIDSLGWRRDTAALPLLQPLLTDPDVNIASATASALGRIGGKEAIAALSAIRDQAPPAVRAAVLEALLCCAESLPNVGASGALAVYRDLFDPKYPVQVRIAAWRGLVLLDAVQRPDLMAKALAGTDLPVQVAALKLVREVADAPTLKACLAQWASLPAESQLAVLDAHLKLGPQSLSTVRTATTSPHVSVRVAAWQALAGLNESSLVPAVVKAAATGEPAEREAARETITRLRGPGMREALLAYLDKAESAEKAEVLRALGQRGDTAAASILLQQAGTGSEPVRNAALESLRLLAVADTITPLLDLAARSKSDTEREPVLKALYAVCEASPDKVATARRVVEAIGKFPVAERAQVLPLLAELGTADALEAARGASRDSNPELVKKAVHVLAQWPNAEPAPYLLEMARSNNDPTVRTLAFRGAVEVAGQESDPGKRLAFLKEAMRTARQPAEKKQVLGQVSQVPSTEALDFVIPQLSDPALAGEAAVATVAIAEKLAPSNAKLADEAAIKVLALVKEGDLAKRAWGLRIKPSSAASFIKDWVVCGPYRRGADGAEVLFNVALGPEKPGEKVEWKSAPRADHVNLMGIFPDQSGCVAYLRTEVIAPSDCDGALLMGSDDGIKAWLNGKVVHANNVDRGEVADQDSAPITLKKGTNELMLKITQGGGGWSASARFVGQDGKPIPGLLVQRPGGASAPVSAAPTKAVSVTPTKPATLPARDSFQKVRLSDQFYAEGAYYGDFNRDGKLDIVAGPFWFEGPDFQKRHEYRPAKTYDPKGYSDNFLTFTGDFSGDGWTDIFCVPHPGIEGFWYENPAGRGQAWKKHLAHSNVGNESPMWGDVNGDGKPELAFNTDGYLGYATPNPSKPDEPWVFTAVSTKDKRYQKYTHGVGFGDINGDGRVDMLEAAGWWEQPSSSQSDKPWNFHPQQFATDGAQMLVYDVNGDGLADVITAWHCHLYGLVWWQQVKSAGNPGWKKHVILSPTPDVSTSDFRASQLHALELVDMNGDGLKDILTGKRFWAHGPTGDKEPDAPAVVFWLELRRNAQSDVTFVPHLVDDDSGVGTQVAATDLNGDRRPDVIVGNKKGIFVHLSKTAAK